MAMVAPMAWDDAILSPTMSSPPFIYHYPATASVLTQPISCSDFDFSSRYIQTELLFSSPPAMSPAEELFHDGKILPLCAAEQHKHQQQLTINDGFIHFDLPSGANYGVSSPRPSPCNKQDHRKLQKTPNPSIEPAESNRPKSDPKIDVGLIPPSAEESLDTVRSMVNQQTEPDEDNEKHGFARSSPSTSPVHTARKYHYQQQHQQQPPDTCYQSQEDYSNTFLSDKLRFGPSKPSSKPAALPTKKRWTLKDFLVRTGDHRVHNNSRGATLQRSYSGRRDERREEEKLAITTPPRYVNNGSRSPIAGGASPHALHYTRQKERAEKLTKRTYLPYTQGVLACLGFQWKDMDTMKSRH